MFMMNMFDRETHPQQQLIMMQVIIIMMMMTGVVMAMTVTRYTRGNSSNHHKDATLIIIMMMVMIMMVAMMLTKPTRSNRANHHGQVVVRLHRLVGVRRELSESSHDEDDADVDGDDDVHCGVDDAHGDRDEYGSDQLISTWGWSKVKETFCSLTPPAFTWNFFYNSHREVKQISDYI